MSEMRSATSPATINQSLSDSGHRPSTTSRFSGLFTCRSLIPSNLPADVGFESTRPTLPIRDHDWPVPVITSDTSAVAKLDACTHWAGNASATDAALPCDPTWQGMASSRSLACCLPRATKAVVPGAVTIESGSLVAVGHGRCCIVPPGRVAHIRHSTGGRDQQCAGRDTPTSAERSGLLGWHVVPVTLPWGKITVHFHSGPHTNGTNRGEA